MKVLLADDDSSVRRVLQYKLQRKGFDVTVAEDGERALELMQRETFDLLLSDIRMPKVDGLELLDRAKNIQPNLKVILITAHATVAQAVQAVKLGAFDYITKPFEDEELFVVIEKAVRFGSLERENRHLKGQLERATSAKKLIGVSRPFREMLATVRKIAPTDATVLLSGESGTGKELVARVIHTESHRGDQPFIAVNCAAIPRELIESELFGHVKGAFTGAVRDKKGKFELADGGTLLLDEIAELPIDLQAKLLRVLQEHTVEPIGSETNRDVDVRVIAATNVDLRQRVAEGKFREDLFYRLNVVPIHVPSLRERRDDIPLLAAEFLRRFAQGAKVKIDPALMKRLIEYDWQGNVRELENLIERLVILRRSDTLTVEDLPPDFGMTAAVADNEPREPATPEQLTFHESERRLILQALERSGWNKTRAAELLNIPRHILIYRLQKYNITREV